MSKKVWFKIFKDLKEKGVISSPRGFKIIELEDYVMEFHPIKDRFCSFKERKLSLRYNVAETAWYLKGDPNDCRMEYYAPFWATLKNPEKPYYHSNYGEYFFKEKQFEYVIASLKADKDTRQASVILCRPNVMMSNTKDKICTYFVGFRIRNNKLNMSVGMRSNDVIRGLSIDMFQFSVIYEMLYNKLLDIYPDLEIGTYIHKSDSFHIYECHFEMLDAIYNSNGDNYVDIECPLISSSNEVDFMLNQYPEIEENIRLDSSKTISMPPDEYKFTTWMINKLTKK